MDTIVYSRASQTLGCVDICVMSHGDFQCYPIAAEAAIKLSSRLLAEAIAAQKGAAALQSGEALLIPSGQGS